MCARGGHAVSRGSDVPVRRSRCAGGRPCDPPPATTASGPRDAGTALVLALFFAIAVLGIVVAGTTLLTASQQREESRFAQRAQATRFARAGLNEALAWMRRQDAQPVTEFAPRLEALASPPVVDTDDPVIGLVRDFQIQGDLWGRYEVWKEWNADPDPQRLAWRQRFAVRDVSAERGASPGSHWRLASFGYIYRRSDWSRAFDEAPNQIIAVASMETETRRLALNPPGQSALSVGDGNSAHVNTMGRILGGTSGAGIFYPQGTGTPTTGPKKDDRVTGTPPLATTPSYDDSVESVFGMRESDLRASADWIVTDAAEFPSPLPDHAVVFATPTATLRFDDVNPLRGKGIVFIKGNVTFSPDNGSDFQGLLYVDGNLTLRAPSTLAGTVVVTGNVTVQGAKEHATIRFDADVLDELQREMSEYRFAAAIRLLRTRE